MSRLLALLTPRFIFLAAFAACAGLLGFGVFLQTVEHVLPCPMCIMQRYAFVAIGVIGLIAGLHHPARLGSRIYAVLLALAALTGGGIAARQTYIQHYPPQIMDCGPDLEFMINSFPLGDALPMIFQGSGDCSKVLWRFLGLSIAEWALVCFAGFIVGAVLAWLGAKNKA